MLAPEDSTPVVSARLAADVVVVESERHTVIIAGAATRPLVA